RPEGPLMRVLVVGGGGREHALCWALDASPSVEALFAAPGNPGIEELATLVPLQPTDLEGLVAFAEAERIDLTVVGPEAPLVAGLVDRLEARGLRAFGPSAVAARIEGSKSWARRLCRDHGIPAPAYAEFDAMQDVARYLSGREGPFVVKADGLAAGKGVTVTDDPREALRAAEDCLVSDVFGEAGRRLLIEECLQ